MKRFIQFLFFLIIIFGFFFYYRYTNFETKELEQDYEIEVVSGDNIQKILINSLGYSPLFTKIYFKLNPIPNDFLKVGNYTVYQGDTIGDILSKLGEKGDTKQEKLVLLEGWNIFDIDEYLTKKGLIESGSFVAEVSDSSQYINKYPFLSSSLTLEGFLYPDTYFVEKNTFTSSGFVKNLLDNFEKKIYFPYLKQETPQKIIEIINIASIVEKEERNEQEKSTVAGILIKRYKENWMIGADITACYSYKLTSEQCKVSLGKYIKEKNEYNTRTKVGLPKTPINNPQVSTILAVLQPKNTSYYYYLHDENGTVHYAETNEEHNRNKALYIK